MATTLFRLGELYFVKGDYHRAESAFNRSLVIFEKNQSPKHQYTAASLLGLGKLYLAERDYSRSESFVRRALGIYEVTLGPEHTAFAYCLEMLAGAALITGDLERSEDLFKRALRIYEKVFGPENVYPAEIILELAYLYQLRGDYARSEVQYKHALAIYEKQLGSHHPHVANTLGGLAMLYSARGDTSRAIQFQARANEIFEHNLSVVLTAGSVDQKRLYVDTLSDNTDATVSLHLRIAPNDLRAARLAFNTILRRKGRALDAMTDEIKVLRNRSNSQDRAVLEQLTAARSRLALLMLRGPDQVSSAEYQPQTANLEFEVARLESEVSRSSEQFRAHSQPVTLDQIQRLLEPNEALVEMLLYRPCNPKARTINERFGTPRYAVYALRHDGSLSWADLGEAAPIDNAVAEFRLALTRPTRQDVNKLGRAVEERVIRPIRSSLRGASRLLLSPDSQLNLIPFEALVQEDDKYMIESYAITYLTSGRDLLRLQIHTESKTGSLIMANPTYDLSRSRNSLNRSGYPSLVTQNNRSVDFTTLDYQPLPGTREEALKIQTLLPGSRVVTETQATEAAVKQVQSPRVLHIATHGFFLPDQPQNADVENGRKLVQGKLAGPSSVKRENPLLRSGLVLAGVKQQQSGPGEDGVLTALEVASLNLWGTKLVVLSACESGLGDVRNGEGVYGLRRALVLAGSETQLISLWKVDDEATRDLMIAYYKRLQAGDGRAEALRQTQLEMLYHKGQNRIEANRGLGVGARSQTAARDWRHPYYWASFIQSGERRSL